MVIHNLLRECNDGWEPEIDADLVNNEDIEDCNVNNLPEREGFESHHGQVKREQLLAEFIDREYETASSSKEIND